METRNPPRVIDPYPKVDCDEKRSMRLSGTTVLRRREPTNPAVAQNHPNMVWDYSRQMRVWPDGKPDSLIESTNFTGSRPHAMKTMNRSGRPYALGVMVGGSPDQAGSRDLNLRPRKKIVK